MGAIVMELLAPAWPWLAAAFAALGWGLFQRNAGARAERDRQVIDRLKARTEADRIDDAVAGRDAGKNREELRKWSSK